MTAETEQQPEQQISADAAQTNTTDTTVQIKKSKNQLRRERREAEWAVKRLELKALRKRKKQEKRERKANDPDFTEPTQKRSKIQVQQHPASMDIVMDCMFDDKMTTREIKSLTRQLSQCHSHNKATVKPMRIHVVTQDHGLTHGELERAWVGYTRWNNVHMHLVPPPLQGENQGYSSETIHADTRSADTLNQQDEFLVAPFSHVPRSSIVYLTADATDVLETLSEDEVYIIGGLVDHNHWKGACLEKAKRMGLRTARLPIGEFIQMSQRKVLAVNHVFHIMILQRELQDWRAAFTQAIPGRKMATEESTADTATKEADDTAGKEADEELQGGGAVKTL